MHLHGSHARIWKPMEHAMKCRCLNRTPISFSAKPKAHSFPRNSDDHLGKVLLNMLISDYNFKRMHMFSFYLLFLFNILRTRKKYCYSLVFPSAFHTPPEEYMFWYRHISPLQQQTESFLLCFIFQEIAQTDTKAYNSIDEAAIKQ